MINDNASPCTVSFVIHTHLMLKVFMSIDNVECPIPPVPSPATPYSLFEVELKRSSGYGIQAGPSGIVHGHRSMLIDV